MDLFDYTPAPKRKGIGGHHAAKPDTTTWLTPPELIEALGPFDLDPCAFAGWPTAERLICLPQDGLRVAWSGRAWLNPPYTTGEVESWLRRLGDHGRGTALIFARTETEAFHAQVWERASGLLFLRGRLHFHADDALELAGAHQGPHVWGRHARGFERCTLCGVAKANAGAPSVLCAYGQDDLDRLAASGLEGALTPLRFARFVLVRLAPSMPPTWRAKVAEAMGDGPVSISDLYRALARDPAVTDRTWWRAKVRQTLQRHFRRIGPAQWAAA